MFKPQDTCKPELKNKFNNIGDIWADYRHENTIISGNNYEEKHFHSHCEIYINLSGKVRFMVNDKIYDISRGDIVVIKSNEFHRCLFTENCEHEHICLWIESPNNSYALECLDGELSKSRLISLSTEEKSRIISQCLMFEEIKDNKDQQLKALSILLDLISTIENATPQNEAKETKLPDVVKKSLKYINTNFAKIKTVQEVAEKFFISHSTLDRYFKKYLNISPKKYLDTKKILYAKKLLENGSSVTEACFSCGFNECSHFISVFKKTFNTTPNSIKKKTPTYKLTPKT